MRNRGSIILLLSLTFGSHAWNQSSDCNYILHRVYTDEQGNTCQTEVSYYDGLGKPIQGFSNASSSKGIYGVSNIKYDELGRVKHEWLSVPMASSCCYVSEAELTSNASTYYKDSKPYVQTLYDALDRPVEKYLPGEDWYDKGKSVRYSYGSNTVNQVRMFLAPLGSDKLEDKGLLTGKEIYHLDGNGGKEVEVYYYDDKGNVIQTQSTNHLGGTETICHNYSFTDKVTSTYHKHTEEGRNPIEEETILPVRLKIAKRQHTAQE